MFFQCIEIREVLTDDFISNKKYFKNEGEEKNYISQNLKVKKLHFKAKLRLCNQQLYTK